MKSSLSTKLSDQQSDDEAVNRRRDEALRKALNTPPKHHRDMKKGKGKKRQDEPTASGEKRDQRSRTP
jgi:hypothetical protein